MSSHLMEVMACPEPRCAAPAEILERFALASTDGPLEHRKTICVHGHVRTPLADARPARHRAGREDR